MSSLAIDDDDDGVTRNSCSKVGNIEIRSSLLLLEVNKSIIMVCLFGIVCSVMCPFIKIPTHATPSLLLLLLLLLLTVDAILPSAWQ